MQIEEILHTWGAACEKAGVSWFLYRQTLLCARGYGSFPEQLKNAQVAVFAKDLRTVAEKVCDLLPAQWKMDAVPFAMEGKPLSFLVDGVPVLEVNVLCPVADAEQAQKLKQNTCSKERGILRYIRIFNTLRGKKNARGKLLLHYVRQIFRKTLTAMDGLVDNAFFCDCFTQKECALISREAVADTVQLPVNELAYPAFAGFETYLADVYGDYETGLFDELGCGLTAQEALELRQHQEKCRQALGFVQQLSEEFGLRYYLLAGSVLGAVRDGGFIPWDDDVDLGIRLEDLSRFEQIVKEQLPLRLPEGFELMQTAPDYPYPRMFSKICYEGRCCIDLWPLIPTYEKGFRATLSWCFAKLFTRSHYYKLGYSADDIQVASKFVGLFLNDRQILTLARRNERTYLHKNTPAYINIYSIYDRRKETILRRWLDTEATAEFDGLTVPVVGCTEEYLTHLYGDYMRRPAHWERASRHVARF